MLTSCDLLAMTPTSPYIAVAYDLTGSDMVGLWHLQLLMQGQQLQIGTLLLMPTLHTRQHSAAPGSPTATYTRTYSSISRGEENGCLPSPPPTQVVSSVVATETRWRRHINTFGDADWTSGSVGLATTRVVPHLGTGLPKQLGIHHQGRDICGVTTPSESW